VGFSFVISEAGYLCIPAVLPILKEVANCCVPEDEHHGQENREHAAPVILGVVANIFQKIIELLARRLRKEPEEGKQVRCRTSFLLYYLKRFEFIRRTFLFDIFKIITVIKSRLSD